MEAGAVADRDAEYLDAANDVFWAMTCLIGRAGANGKSRATLPLVIRIRSREVGANPAIEPWQRPLCWWRRGTNRAD